MAEGVAGAYLTVEDVSGASMPPLMSPRHPHTVVFATGPFVVVWDWRADRKRVLRQHRCAVTSICFSQTGDRMVSADAEQLLVWNSVSWELAEKAQRPVGRTGEFGAVGQAAQAGGQDTTPKHMRITTMQFLDGDRSLVSLETCADMKALQSLRIWQLEERSGIKASAEHGLDQDHVHSVSTRQKGHCIYTCSNGELSAWTCNDRAYGNRFGNMARLWRIECDEYDGNFVDVTAAATMDWVILAISHGRLLIMDEHGTKLRTVVREQSIFTSCCMGNEENLLVGTSKGTVLWFNLPSLEVWRRMPYDLALRDSIDSARTASAMALQSALDPDNGITGVRIVALSGFSGLCMRYTADQTISVIDLSTGHVCNASFGHLDGISCLCSTSSIRMKGVCVYTGSLDETVGVWELDGATSGTQQSFFDIPSNIHPSLTYRRGLTATRVPNKGPGSLLVGGDKLIGTPDALSGAGKALLAQQATSTQADSAEGAQPNGAGSMRVQSIAVDSIRRLLACGLGSGSCLIFDLRTNKMQHCVDVCRSRVAGLAFVRGANYLIARSAHGWVWVLDAIAGFKKSMIVQQPDKLRDSESYVWPCHKVLVVEASLNENDDRSPADRAQASILTSFQVVTLLEPRTVALYQVVAHKFGGLQNASKHANLLTTISVEASPVDFALHSSHHYVYVLSGSGRVQVNNLRPTGDAARGGLVALPTLALKWREAGSEVRTKGTEIKNERLAAALQSNATFRKEEWEGFQVQNVTMDSCIKVGESYFIPAGLEADLSYVGTCLALDPSGLYLATVCTDHEGSVSTLSLWEAGTGELIDSVQHLPVICTVCFTSDNEGIIAGCSDGALVMLHLPRELTRDTSFALLGGPHVACHALLETLAASIGTNGDKKARPPPAASGTERHELCASVPDPVARVLPGTSGKAVQNLWSDKPIWLPALPPGGT